MPILYRELVTTTDVNLYQASLTTFLEQLFQTRIAFEEKLDSSFSDVHKAMFLERLKQDKIDTTDTIAVKRLVEKMQTEIAQLPVLSLSIAVSLPNKVLKRITVWLEQLLGQSLVLDVAVDEQLLGGVAIYHKGQFRDYSLRRRLEELARGGKMHIAYLFGDQQAAEAQMLGPTQTAAAPTQPTEKPELVMPQILKQKKDAHKA